MDILKDFKTLVKTKGTSVQVFFYCLFIVLSFVIQLSRRGRLWSH